MIRPPVAAGMLAVALAGTPLAAPADAAPAARGLGRVVKAIGLTINGKPAAAGALVRPGDRLETTTGGNADVVLADGAIFRLYPGSKAKLPVINRRRTFVELVSGAIMSLVGRPMDYRVKAPRAVAAVGGTCFYMQSTADSPNYACACSGMVYIGPRGGAATPVDGGFNTHIGMMVEDLGFKPAGAKNHDDQQMWELGKELEKATGIPNRYKALAKPSAAPDVTPAADPAPAPSFETVPEPSSPGDAAPGEPSPAPAP